jgi:hypothetical protein
MHSFFMHRTVSRTLATITVVLLPVLAGCGGGETDSDPATASSQGDSGLEGRAQALSASPSALDTAQPDSASVFGPAAGTTEAQKFGSPTGMAGDLFGLSVAANGSNIVVGATQQSLFRITNTTGSAYVFDAAGVFVRELVPPSPTERRRNDAYGSAVAASGSLIVVGSPRAADVGSFAGEVFIFNAQTGAQLAKLVPTGTRRNPADGAGFGSAVDASADRIVVGAPGTFGNGGGSIGGVGAIYLYDANTRRLITRVIPQGAQPKDNVGSSVAVDGNTVVAGAPFDSSAAREAGAVYGFNASNGSVRFKLTASDASASDFFGFAVSTSGGLIAVGAPADDDRGSASGSVYIFNATTGAFLRKIVASDGESGDQFGIAVDLVGDKLAVGAWGDNGGAGSTYVFDVTTGAQVGKLVASDAAPNDILGRSVAISNSDVIAGAARDADRGTDSGSVYRFGLPTP